jgi:hypothetical protein
VFCLQVMAAFMNLRGTPAQVACADIVLCVLVLRPHVETLFGGSGGARSGGGMNGGSYLANASSRGMGGLGVGMRGGGAGRDSGGGGGPQFGAGIDAAEASALGMVSVDSPFSLPYPSTTRLTTQTPPISTQIPLKYHSNTNQSPLVAHRRSVRAPSGTTTAARRWRAPSAAG